MVRSLFDRARAARERLGGGDLEGARTAFDGRAWLDAWNVAVEAVAGRVAAVVRGRLERAQLRSGFPPRRLRPLLPTADDARVLRGKLEAAGIPLEQVIDRPIAGASWWDETRRRASALEDSWDRMENVVRLELAATSDRIERVERWRPSPLVPLVVGGVVAALLIWLGLAIGGIAPRPAFLDSVTDWFWSLPWP
jgi:hypothetical protein